MKALFDKVNFYVNKKNLLSIFDHSMLEPDGKFKKEVRIAEREARNISADILNELKIRKQKSRFCSIFN